MKRHWSPGWGVFERFNKEPRTMILPAWLLFPGPRRGYSPYKEPR